MKYVMSDAVGVVMLVVFLFIGVPSLFAGCPQPPAPVPHDASDAALLGDTPAGSCASMCSNLGAIGCLEGADANCVAACTQNVVAPITPMPIACLAKASTKEAARACGGVRCQ